MLKKRFCMISAVNNNNPSFTSVIPVRVILDGTEVYSPKYARPATQQLTRILAGPVKGDPKKLEIVRKFAQHDPDYDYTLGIYGAQRGKSSKKLQPSDFFRCIVDVTGTYLFTGMQANKLKEIGKILGKLQQTCKEQKVSTNFELQCAKRSYSYKIWDYLHTAKVRLTEGFDRNTKQRYGEQVSLCLRLSSNKKYGQSAFKMELEDVSYPKVEP